MTTVRTSPVLDRRHIDPSGVTDAWDTIQDAVDRHGSVKIDIGPRKPGDQKKRRVRLSQPVVIADGQKVSGAGKYLTILEPDPGTRAFTIRAHSQGARQFDDDEYEEDLPNIGMGAVVEDLMIAGVRGNGQAGIWFEGQSDKAQLSRIGFYMLDQGGVDSGTPIDGQGCTRESWFNQLTFERCGSPGYPAMFLHGDATTTLGNGNNHWNCHEMQFVYCPAEEIRIENNAVNSTVPSRIVFTDLMLHGMPDTEANAHDMMVLEGAMTDVQVYGLKANGPGSTPGQCMIRLKENSTGMPQAVQIYGNLAGGGGDGIVVEQCDAFRAELTANGQIVGDYIKFGLDSIPVGSYAEVDLLGFGPNLTADIDASVASRVACTINGIAV